MSIQLMTKRNTYYASKAQSDHDAAIQRAKQSKRISTDDRAGDIVILVILTMAIAFTWVMLK